MADSMHRPSAQNLQKPSHIENNRNTMSCAVNEIRTKRQRRLPFPFHHSDHLDSSSVEICWSLVGVSVDTYRCIRGSVRCHPSVVG